MLPCIALLLPIIYIILIIFLPETPLFLLRAGKTERAEKSFYFYKSLSVEDPQSKKEFEEFVEGLVIDGPVEKVTAKDYCKLFFDIYALCTACPLTRQQGSVESLRTDVFNFVHPPDVGKLCHFNLCHHYFRES